MSTQVVSSASLGEQTKWGSNDVANAALDARVIGFVSTALGRVLVTSSGAVFYFDFVSSAPEASLRFDFTPSQRPITSVSLRDTQVFGFSEVTNAAQGALYIGFGLASLRVGRVLVSRDSPFVFDFSAFLSTFQPLQLSFDGRQLAGFKGFDASAFGTPLFPSTITFAAGALYTRFGPASRVLPSSFVEFDFVAGPAHATPSISLSFSGAQVVPMQGVPASVFGGAAVFNVAHGVLSASVGLSQSIGRSIVSFSDVSGILTFNFISGPAFASPAIQLAFGTGKKGIFVGSTFTAYGVPSLTIVPVIAPAGFDSFVSGSGDVLGGHKTAFVSGFDSFVSGEFYVNTFRIFVQGLHSLFIGTHSLAGGSPPGTITINLVGLHSLTFGTQDVSNFFRFISNIGLGRSDVNYGTLWISHSPREVAPSGKYSFLPGFPRVGTHQSFETVSFSAQTQYGLATVYIRALYPDGFVATKFPEFFTVSRSPRTLSAFSWRSDTFGDADVFNSWQFIIQNPPNTDPDTYRGAVFGRPTHFSVRNRNRRVFVSGFDSARFAWFPANVVSLGTPIFVVGVDTLKFQTFPYYHFIAHGVRHLKVQGVDMFRTTGAHQAYLAAHAIAPSGWNSFVVGSALVKRMLAYVFVHGKRLDKHGVHWVSYDPRGFEMVSTTQSLQMGSFRVGRSPAYIVMGGLHTFSFTNFTSIVKPVPKIAPWPVVNDSYGLPFVWNVTPEIQPVGRNMLQISDTIPRVEHLLRYLDVKGVSLFISPKFIVKDSKQYVFFMGLCRTIISNHFAVQNLQPDPPSTRILLFFGIEPLGNQVPKPLVRFNIIWPNSFVLVTQFGVFSITSNNILFTNAHFLPWGMWESDRFIVSGGMRNVDFKNTGLLSENILKPRMSPHTIWMRLDTPDQAKACNPGKNFHVVNALDTNSDNTGVFPFFGRTRVLGGDQVIHHRHNIYDFFGDFLKLGAFNCESSIRYLLPVGKHSFRTGYPRAATPSDQIVETYSGAVPDAVFGASKLFLWNYNAFLLISGSVFSRFGVHYISKRPINAYMVGLPLTVYGNNKPMVYHYPRGPKMLGHGLTRWGTAWASHSPRDVAMIGHDSAISMPTAFPLRMRVQNLMRSIKVHGGNLFAKFGEYSLTPGQAVVRMYGRCPPCASQWFEVKASDITFTGYYATLFGNSTIQRIVNVFSIDSLVSPDAQFTRVSFDASGRDVRFDFSSVAPGAPAIHMLFDGAPVVTIRGLESLMVGQYEIRNMAQIMSTQGLEFYSSGLPQVIPLSGRVVFDFSSTASGLPAIHMLFGGAPVVIAHGLESLKAGMHEVQNASQVVGVHGFEFYSSGLIKIIPSADYVMFDFSSTASGLPAIHLPFGGAMIVPMRGGESLVFGGGIVV